MLTRGGIAIGLTAVLLLLGGCVDVGMRPSAEVTTTSPAWINWFKIDYTVEAEPQGTKRITGLVYNTYGEFAQDVQILTQALDSRGAVVAQRINWVPGGVPPMSRSYFQVRGMPAADKYQVSVWSFTFHQSPGWF
jgi:hypothetical protein